LAERLGASPGQRYQYRQLNWYREEKVRSIVQIPARVDQMVFGEAAPLMAMVPAESPEDKPQQIAMAAAVQEPPAVTDHVVGEHEVMTPWHPPSAILYRPVPGFRNTLLIDIEGRPNDCVELTIIACDGHIPLEVFHNYAVPGDEDQFKKDARACHGLNLRLLKRLTNRRPEQLVELGKRFARKYAPALIISNDQQMHSDVHTLQQTWGEGFAYRNIFLGNWTERDSQMYHRLALQEKFEERAVKGITCPFSVLHSTPLKEKTRSNGMPNTTDSARNKAKAHCSLYDTLEIFFFVEECIIRA
jgi:hypothetical protein